MKVKNPIILKKGDIVLAEHATIHVISPNKKLRVSYLTSKGIERKLLSKNEMIVIENVIIKPLEGED